VCVEQGGDGVQALLLLVARKVVEVVEEVRDDDLVVVDAVAQGVVLRVLFPARLVDGGDDGAGFGHGQGVDVLKVAEFDLVAHFLLLLYARLRARDEARRAEHLDLRGLALWLRVVLHGGCGWCGWCGWCAVGSAVIEGRGAGG
jgi:hypothetical protein